MKKKLLIAIVIVPVIITGAVVANHFGTQVDKVLKPTTRQEVAAQYGVMRDCHFEMLDLQERSGDYGVRGPGFTDYQGIIRNMSDRSEHLKTMIAKFYTPDDIPLGTFYASIEKDMEPGAEITFKIHAQNVDGSGGLIKDIYPWFSTCK